MTDPGFQPPPPPPPYPGQGAPASVVYTGPIVPGQVHPITSDEKTMGMLSHLLGLLVGFVGPLILMLTKGKESPWVKDQSTEALNFALTSLILMIVTLCLFWPVSVVFQIIATMKANQGVAYRYPINFRMVK